MISPKELFSKCVSVFMKNAKKDKESHERFVPP